MEKGADGEDDKDEDIDGRVAEWDLHFALLLLMDTFDWICCWVSFNSFSTSCIKLEFSSGTDDGLIVPESSASFPIRVRKICSFDGVNISQIFWASLNNRNFNIGLTWYIWEVRNNLIASLGLWEP